MTISVQHQIPFHDVDSLGIVWHGHHYKYFELARTALYRSLGLDIQDMQRIGFSFPVIETQCRYTGSLRYGQQITISAHISAQDYYIQISYRINDTQSGQRAAHGHTKQAVCDLAGNLQPCVPDSVQHLLTGHAAS